MDYHPRVISWNVTGACHLRCPHCYLDARRRWPGELSTKEALGLIDGMAEAGTELLILTGGEPLLRRDLPTLAGHAAEKGISVVLGTAGTLIDRKRARVLRQSGVVAAGVSIDFIDPAKHDAFRGVQGSWSRAVKGIEACREEGLEVLVHTTAMQTNQEEIPAIIEFAHDKEARAFHLFFLVCTGRGEQLTDLSPHEYERVLGLVLDAQDLYPDMMVRARCAPYIGRLALERGVPPMGSAGCLAATSYCRITPTGDVTPCPYLPVVAGNVRLESFQRIWEDAPALTRFRGPLLQLGGKCGECPLSQGENPICVGCRARAFALADDDLGSDPWCLYQPQREAAGAGPFTDALVPATLPATIVWTPEAEERLQRVPSFIRGRVKQSAETYARQQGLIRVTPDVLDHLRQRAYGGGSHPPLPAAAAENSESGRNTDGTLAGRS